MPRFTVTVSYSLVCTVLASALVNALALPVEATEPQNAATISPEVAHGAPRIRGGRCRRGSGHNEIER